ncbi:MAG: hypothetical protein Ct9H300mP8_09370 [Gammaproteobacteria bacterium]|nr:MAG: hypothetical protein Ct9H300mP8_09370 [Gammaproteobacteria bacterium]
MGWSDQGPFDAILVTAASRGLPDALLDQLAEDGRMVIPVGDGDVQELKVIDREGDAWHKKRLISPGLCLSSAVRGVKKQLYFGILSIFARGIAMGIAEIVPGISGSTIALITGIYSRMINALASFSAALRRCFSRGLAPL